MGGSQQQSPVLLARIAEKKAELANLKDLQALSGGLADQMQMLADKLSTLSDGTEGMSTFSFQSESRARNVTRITC
jgi:DASH complex subunit DAD2